MHMGSGEFYFLVNCSLCQEFLYCQVSVLRPILFQINIAKLAFSEYLPGIFYSNFLLSTFLCLWF